MLKNKDCIKQLLWMLALTIPWGLGGFVVHTALSLSAGIIAYWAAGLFVPLIFYLVQRKGWGSELGAVRAAVHVPLWLSFVVVEMVVFWNYLPSIDRMWKSLLLRRAWRRFWLFPSLCSLPSSWTGSWPFFTTG